MFVKHKHHNHGAIIWRAMFLNHAHSAVQTQKPEHYRRESNTANPHGALHAPHKAQTPDAISSILRHTGEWRHTLDLGPIDCAFCRFAAALYIILLASERCHELAATAAVIRPVAQPQIEPIFILKELITFLVMIPCLVHVPSTLNFLGQGALVPTFCGHRPQKRTRTRRTRTNHNM